MFSSMSGKPLKLDCIFLTDRSFHTFRVKWKLSDTYKYQVVYL